MKKNWQSGAGVILGALAFVAVVATPLARAPQAADPNVTVDPSILSTMQFRHLSVFSRGGRSTAVAGVPSNPSLFYMGSTGGGVWQTNDSGVSWRNISDGFFEAGSISAIDVSLSDPNVIYVGTGSACPRGNVSPGVGMYKSTDAGKTWSHIGLRSWHDRPRENSPDQSEPGLRRRPGQSVCAQQGTRRLPLEGWRHHVGTGARHQRPHGRG
ncbi:MAG: hypothetical protein IPL75_13920 [Acidobacteria bacterium]|nr:hypothetical protein [Acidobacteriota bacterium]